MRDSLCRVLFVLVIFAAAACAQVVRVCNYGSAVFAGWHRTAVDALPPHYRGATADGVEYAVGRQLGLLGYVLDVHLKLPPGVQTKIDLAGSKPIDVKFPVSTVAIDSWGRPLVSGAKLAFATTSVGARENPLLDGAGMLVHWSGRPWPASPMFSVDVWATVYPDQPWFVGECVLTCSNPAVPDVVATVPAGGFVLQWSNGIVLVDGVTLGTPLIATGESFGNGQSRAWRFVAGWLDRSTIDTVVSSMMESAAAVAVNGVGKPGLLGMVTTAPPGFDALGWARERLPRARAALLGWDVLRDRTGGTVGVSPRAGDTGEQEDQPGMNKGTEEYAPNGVGCYWTRYYASLGQLRRPERHLEADGRQLDLAAHPGLCMWVAQPHVPASGNTDQLGKSRQLVLGSETHGWEGPDREHWLIGTLAQSYQWTASPALQSALETEARIFWFTETVDPRFSTSHSDASRSWGWQAIVASWLWLGLEDRTLAAKIRQREHERVALVYSREFTIMRPVAWIDVRTGDDRVLQPIGGGFLAGTLAYQQSVAAMMQLAGEILDDPQQRDLAQLIARTAVDWGWTRDAHDTLIAWDMVGVHLDGSPLRPDQYVEGGGAHRTGWFDASWCALAPWALLRAEPTNAKARAIWQQLQAGRLNDWLLPLTARR